MQEVDPLPGAKRVPSWQYTELCWTAFCLLAIRQPKFSRWFDYSLFSSGQRRDTLSKIELDNFGM